MDIIVDHGEKIYIAEHDEIDKVIENIVAEERKRPDRSSYDGSFYYEMWEKYIGKHTDEGLYYGYYYYNNDEENGHIMVMFLYKKDKGYQRVQFENSSCLDCGRRWRIANPSYLGIYPNYDFDMSECEYPLLCCPGCGGKLSRNAIWIGSELDERWQELS